MNGKNKRFLFGLGGALIVLTITLLMGYSDDTGILMGMMTYLAVQLVTIEEIERVFKNG